MRLLSLAAVVLVFSGCEGLEVGASTVQTLMAQSPSPKLLGLPEDPPTPMPFMFSRDEKGCVNSEGEPGLNPGHLGECGNLEGVDLRGKNYVGLSFRGANLQGASFAGADFSRVDFRGADLRRANLFQDAKLDGALFDDNTKTSLSEESLRQAGFVEEHFGATDSKLRAVMDRWKNKEEEQVIAEMIPLLHHAAKGNQGLSEQLIDKKYTRALGLLVRWKRGYVHLLSQAVKECTACVDILLEGGADVNKANHDETDTPLSVAVSENDHESARKFLERGAEVNFLLRMGYWRHPFKSAGFTRLTVLHFVKDLEMAALLLDKGADIGKFNFAALTLNDMAKGKEWPQFFIERGADVNAVLPETGETYLHRKYKPIWGLDKLRKLLDTLEGGELDFNVPTREGFTVLAKAFMMRVVDQVDHLVALGADPKRAFVHPSGRASSLFAHAVRGEPCYEAEPPRPPKDLAFFQAMLTRGFPINGTDRSEVPTMVRFASHYRNCVGHDGVQEIFNLIKDAGVELDAQDSQGSALHLAARRSSVGMLELLLGLGLNPNLVGPHGETPLSSMQDKDRRAMLRVLVAGGADLDQRVKGRTQLHRSMYSRPVEELLEILELGADPKAVTEGRFGGNYLQQMLLAYSPCLFQEKLPFAEKLLELGVGVNDQDLVGKTSLHYWAQGSNFSTQKGYLECIRQNLSTLLGWGADPNLYPPEEAVVSTLIFTQAHESDIQRLGLAGLIQTLLDGGMDPNQRDAKGTLLDATMRAMDAQSYAVLMRAGAVDEVQTSPSFPEASTPSYGACELGADEMGWKADHGGCLSPYGVIWSTGSYRDSCNNEGCFEGRYSTGKITRRKRAESYCHRLEQGGVRSWDLPTLREYAQALAAGYFRYTKGTLWVQDKPRSRDQAILSRDGTWQGDEGPYDGPQAFCVAR